MIVLFRLLARLPLPVLHALGALLGWALYLGGRRSGARLRENLLASGLCVPDCRALLRRAVSEWGKALAELPAVWFKPYPEAVRLVHGTSGLDRLAAARAQGRGVILLSPHIGCFEIVSLYLAQDAPFTALYKPARAASLDRLMREGRTRGAVRLAPADFSGVRALLAALRRGETIGILPDHIPTAGDGVWAPFFGRPAYTPTLALNLARKTGAPVLFAIAERLPRGRGFHLHVIPFDDAHDDDPVVTAPRMNAAIEAIVARFPAQYHWHYNRHKQPRHALRPGAAP